MRVKSDMLLSTPCANAHPLAPYKEPKVKLSVIFDEKQNLHGTKMRDRIQELLELVRQLQVSQLEKLKSDLS